MFLSHCVLVLVIMSHSHCTINKNKWVDAIQMRLMRRGVTVSYQYVLALLPFFHTFILYVGVMLCYCGILEIVYN